MKVVTPHQTALVKRSTYRRPYKKSTSGCGACKSRKVKCDEARPVCGNCKKHYTDASACQYGGQARPSKPAITTVEIPTIAMRPVTLDSTNTLALRLMHHYTISFGLGRPAIASENAEIAHSLWAVEVPCVAFTSEIVMNALLGISAWHLWAMNPLDKSLVLASRVYFGKAIKLQRVALEKKDKQSIESAFITGLILAHHNWLLSHANESAPTGHLSLETYHLCTGTRSLSSKVSSNWYKYTALCAPALNKHLQLPQHDTVVERAIQDGKALLEYVRNTDINQEDKEAYRDVIQIILELYAFVADPNEDISKKENTIVSFLHRANPSFIPLLEQEEPIAVGLLSRVWVLLSLLKKTSTAWYIHGAGTFHVSRLALSGIQKLIPPDMKWIMEWPEQLLSENSDHTEA